MKKRSNLLGAIAAATLFLSASPASAQQGTPVYNSAFFSDAAHQTVVGAKRWSSCDLFDQPHYGYDGTITQYEESYFIGYCYGGYLILGGSPPE